ncbi:MAG: PEP-CTERM sorting domain-containing protein [Pirellulales bacterium]|nr:PEP-CTERM sorting domain-containing protein [Pirellulales bacterium]
MRRMNLCAMLAIFCWVVLASSGAPSATLEWTGNTSNNWNEASNWSPKAVPVYDDIVRVWDDPAGRLPLAGGILIGGGTGQVHVRNQGIGLTVPAIIVGWEGEGELLIENEAWVYTSEFIQVGAEEITGAQGTVIVRHSGSLLDCGEIRLGGHTPSPGVLRIENGGDVLSGEAQIGSISTSAGSWVLVDGDGSTWNLGGSNLLIGPSGSGDVTISNHGLIQCDDVRIGSTSSGVLCTLTVTDVGSRLECGPIRVGNSSLASMSVEAGAVVQSTGESQIGHGSASEGEVTVTGNGSLWNTNSGTLLVGDSGEGILNISNKGQVLCGTAYIGTMSGSSGNQVTVNGSDSLWSTGGLNVGAGGEGTLTIENKGTVTSTNVSIGGGYDGPGASGTVNVNGSGSNWVISSGWFAIGEYAAGELNITDGGLVSSQSALIGTYDSSLGNMVTLSGTGSTWNTNGEFVSVGEAGAGTVQVRTGSQVLSGITYVGYDVTGNGHIDLMGGTWDTGGEDLFLGLAGTGTLDVRTLGQLTTADGYVAYGLGSVGTVDLQGGRWDCESLHVGTLGTAMVQVRPGAELAIADTLNIGPNGTLHLDGGHVWVSQLGTLDGDLDFESGTLQITNDFLLDAGQPLGASIQVDTAQTVIVDQTLFVNPLGMLSIAGGQVTADVLQNDGLVSVGTGGQLSIGSGLENSSTLMLAGGTIAGPGLLTNGPSGSLAGDGTITANVDNYGTWVPSGAMRVSGTVNNYGEVQINALRTLRQDGPMSNFGLIALNGGALAGSGTLLNQPGGTIRGGSGVTVALTNAGLIHATTGSTLLITNLSGGNLSTGELRVEDDASLQVISSFANAGLVRLLGDGAILAGGDVTNSGTIVGAGRVANSIVNTGQIRADGPGTLILAGSSVTNAAGGLIEVQENATLIVSNGLAVNSGSLTLRGGTFDNNATTMTNNGDITGAGTLRTGGLINNGHVGVGNGDLDVVGSVVNNGDVAVQPGATATFYGPVSGPGSFPGAGTIVFLSSYSPGSSPGDIAFGGNLTLVSTSQLTMELGGAEAGTEYDRLQIAGELTLDGVLEIVLIDEFTPSAGNVFDILDWSSCTGTFDHVLLPDLGAELCWDLGSLYDSGELAVLTSTFMPGDANRDGRVDALDARTLAENWLKSTGMDWSKGDFNDDGAVDDLDASIMAANWGAGTEGHQSVPEPSTAVLAIAALAAVGLLRRRSVTHGPR